MTEIKTNAIPHRLKNVNKQYPYVAGAVDIIDDVKGKTQDVINKEVDDEFAFHQSEINALDSQNYVTVEATDQTSAVTDVLPATGSVDTVYRVGSWDGSQYDPTVYSEYAWDANQSIYRFLDKKQYSIATKDDFIEPDSQSRSKLTDVGAVADVFGHYEDNPEYLMVITDSQKRMGICITKDLDLIINGGEKGLVDKDIIKSFYYKEDAEGRFQIVLDKNNKMASYREKDGTLWENHLRVEELTLGKKAENTIKTINAVLQKSNAEVLVNKLTPISYSGTEGWDEIDSKQLQAFIDKCRLHSSIVWTPKHDVRGNITMDDRWVLDKGEWVHPGSLFVFADGVPVMGIPYSGTQQIDKTVGFDISMTTFMTAVNNPYSLLYTECIRNDKNQYSAWFLDDANKCSKYIGPNSAGLYYGSVCSSLSSFAIGLPLDYKTYQYMFLANYGSVLGMVYPYRDMSKLKVGDVINSGSYPSGSGHCVVISGIKRDTEGNIIAIKLTEQTNISIRNIVYDDSVTMIVEDTEVPWPYDDIAKYASINDELYPCNYERTDNREFHCPLNNQDIDDVTYYGFEDRELLHRKYNNILRNVRMYENVFEDTWSNDYVYNNDICTFAGDKAVFREGDLIVLNYNLDGEHGDWNAIELFKDDILVDTFELAGEGVTNLPESSIDGDGNAVQSIDQNGHAFKISEVYEFAYGSYKARMTDGTNNSDFTYFNVIGNTVSAKYDSKVLIVDFSSKNAVPVGLRVCSEDGSVRSQYVFSPIEVIYGSVDIPYEYLKASGINFTESKLYVKVYFKDEFGMVTNQPLLVNFGSDEASEGGGDD